MSALNDSAIDVLASVALGEEAQRLLFLDARTANTFSDEPVDDEKLRSIFELSKWPPTSGNTQPLRVLAVRSPEARARLVAHLNEGNRAKTSTAPLTLLLAADTRFDEHMDRLLPYLENASANFADAARRAKIAPFNATLQAAYLILAIRAAGLAAGPMSGFDADGMDREFFPDGRLRSILVVNLGKPGPDAWFDRLPRLEYEEVVTEI
jgi:3-hydroxypropanoate dehydrogenase